MNTTMKYKDTHIYLQNIKKMKKMKKRKNEKNEKMQKIFIGVAVGYPSVGASGCNGLPERDGVPERHDFPGRDDFLELVTDTEKNGRNNKYIKSIFFRK